MTEHDKILAMLEGVDPKDTETLGGFGLRLIPHIDYRNYLASTDGRIYSLNTRRCEKKQSLCAKGRMRVNLYSHNLKRNQMWNVHRLVALAWHANPDNKPQVCHRDGNKLNNHACNLYWGTQRENTEDAIRHGTHKGENNGRAKLTREQVDALRVCYDMVERGMKERFTKLFTIKTSTIKRAIKGETWK